MKYIIKGEKMKRVLFFSLKIFCNIYQKHKKHKKGWYRVKYKNKEYYSKNVYSTLGIFQ